MQAASQGPHTAHHLQVFDGTRVEYAVPSRRHQLENRPQTHESTGVTEHLVDGGAHLLAQGFPIPACLMPLMVCEKHENEQFLELM